MQFESGRLHICNIILVRNNKNNTAQCATFGSDCIEKRRVHEGHAGQEFMKGMQANKLLKHHLGVSVDLTTYLNIIPLRIIFIPSHKPGSA